MNRALLFLAALAAILSPTVAARAAHSRRGPLDLPLLQREKRAVVAHSPLASGSLEALFDANLHTLAVSAAPPGAGPGGPAAFWQVDLDRPQPVEAVELYFAGGSTRWTLAAADSAADLAARRRSYRVLVPPRVAAGDAWDEARIGLARPYRVYRMECRALEGGGGVRLAEWSLFALQSLARLEVDAFVPNVARGERLPLRALGRFSLGARENLTPEVTWEVAPPGRGRVDGQGRLEGLEPGPARVTAVLGEARSAPLAVEVLPAGLPDWDVTHIERQPRGTPEGGLKPGQLVYWFAHVKNYGTGEAPPVEIAWRVDGKTVLSGRLPRLERFAQTEVILSTRWDGLRRSMEVVVDPGGRAPEFSKVNNRLRVLSDAVSVGFWVEESAVRYFHHHQRDLGVGSNSWEDWAQRQIALWNEWMEKGAWLLSGPVPGLAPGAAPLRWRDVRWRLDRIIVVGDGLLPLAPGSPIHDPDRRDRSVSLMWGFPARNPRPELFYNHTGRRGMDNPFHYQVSLMAAMARVRLP